MEDLAIIAERDDLERSVSTGDSFLACFVPLLTKMMTSDVLPEVYFASPNLAYLARIFFLNTAICLLRL